VPIRLLRGGKSMTVNVTMGDLSKAQIPEYKFVVKDNRFLDGATVSDITPAARESLNMESSTVKGVIVTEVQSGSAAASTGLQPGDVIVDINGMKTENLAGFKEVLKKLEGRKASITIIRQGMTLSLTIIR
jgi:S1-C subfamily serine protease